MTGGEIARLLESTIERLGYELIDLEAKLGGKGGLVRLYIDKPDGVGIEDCERVSRQVSDVLDVSEMMNGQYTLEVSSPGMDRTLFKAAHYEQNVGATVDVRLNFPFDGKKRIVGMLAGYENDEAIVQMEAEEYVLPIEFFGVTLVSRSEALLYQGTAIMAEPG